MHITGIEFSGAPVTFVDDRLPGIIERSCVFAPTHEAALRHVLQLACDRADETGRFYIRIATTTIGLRAEYDIEQGGWNIFVEGVNA